jgi:hypothetical protein
MFPRRVRDREGRHMHRGTTPSAEAQLQNFLATHLDAPQCDDVGALLGQAMLLLDSRVAGEPQPSEWHEAASAALSGGVGSVGRRRGNGDARPDRPH